MSDGPGRLPETVPAGDAARILAWAGSEAAAAEWFESHPVAGFGGLTPREVLETRGPDALSAHLDHVAAGGFA